MLWQRVLTALVLLPPLLAAIVWLPSDRLVVLFAALGGVLGAEWAAVGCRDSRPAARAAYGAACTLALIGVWFSAWREALILAAAGAATLWWLHAVGRIRRFPDSMARPLPSVVLRALGLTLVVATVGALGLFHADANGRWRLLYVFGLVWAADVGAYFVGRALGRRKLAPKVSPGKTVEGALGGLAVVLIWSLALGGVAFDPEGWQWPGLVVLTLTAGALSIVGDLGISMFKRISGMKDSGRLLPGHGGMLDRLDSLLAAAPLMLLGTRVLGL